MTRSEAKDFLISLGIEEPTKENIDAYLNQFNGEQKKYSDKLEQGRKDAELVDELRAKLEDLENQNLSDIDKAKKETETSNKMVAELQTKIKTMELKNALATKGITGEDADNLIKSLTDGNLDVELLGNIIANRESEAMLKKEKEIADGTLNPNGKKIGSDGDDAEKTSAEKVAESVIASFGGSKASTDIVSSYIN